MDAVEVFAGKQKIVLADVPGDVTRLIVDAPIGRCGDKAALLFIEVAPIFEGQAVSQITLQCNRMGRGWIASCC